MKYILFFLLLPGLAIAERGVSFLGMEAFDSETCTKALRVYEAVKRPWAAMLWGSFGKTHICPERFLALPQKTKRLEIYADNGTCNRSGRHCTKYDRPEFTKRIKQIAAWIKPRISLASYWVMMRLEDDEREATVKKKRTIMRRYLPRAVKLGRNPNVKTSYFSGFDIAELHGFQRTDFPRGKIRVLSNDGFDLDLGSERMCCIGYLRLSQFVPVLRASKAAGINNLLWFQAQGGCTEIWVEPINRHPELWDADIRTINKLLRN